MCCVPRASSGREEVQCVVLSVIVPCHCLLNAGRQFLVHPSASQSGPGLGDDTFWPTSLSVIAPHPGHNLKYIETDI